MKNKLQTNLTHLEFPFKAKDSLIKTRKFSIENYKIKDYQIKVAPEPKANLYHYASSSFSPQENLQKPGDQKKLQKLNQP